MGHEFATEAEYQAFITWAQEGSTIGQRSTIGDGPSIPDYWRETKAALDVHGSYPATRDALKELIREATS